MKFKNITPGTELVVNPFSPSSYVVKVYATYSDKFELNSTLEKFYFSYNGDLLTPNAYVTSVDFPTEENLFHIKKNEVLNKLHHTILDGSLEKYVDPNDISMLETICNRVSLLKKHE